MVAVLAVEASTERYEFRIEGKSSRIAEEPFALHTRGSIALPTKPSNDHQPAAVPNRREWLLHR